jgi:hypothetical protein
MAIKVINYTFLYDILTHFMTIEKERNHLLEQENWHRILRVKHMLAFQRILALLSRR